MKKDAAKVITIFSCKGGVGKTTTTLNLAGIYSLMDKNVLIIDLDLNSGSIAFSLNLDVNKNIYNLVDDMSNNRFKDNMSYVTKYNDKIDVIAAPIDPRKALKIDAKYISLLISSYIYKYDVILIDTSHYLNPISLTAVDKSDNTLFMVSNDPVALKNSRNMLTIFEDIEQENYKILLNSIKDSKKDFFSLYDIKTILKHNVDYIIDNSFFIKDIDKYVINGEILTLNNKIRLTKKNDVMKLTKLATSLLVSKPSKVEVEKDG